MLHRALAPSLVLSLMITACGHRVATPAHSATAPSAAAPANAPDQAKQNDGATLPEQKTTAQGPAATTKAKWYTPKVFDPFPYCSEAVRKSFDYQLSHRAELERPILNALAAFQTVKTSGKGDLAQAGWNVRYEYEQAMKTIGYFDKTYGEFTCVVKGSNPEVKLESSRLKGDLPSIQKSMKSEPAIPAQTKGG